MTDHPEVTAGALGRKELDFFAPYWNRSFTQDDIDAYHRHFPAKGHLVRGEWSPAYLRDPWAPACLARAAPEAKLLVLLRDPIERLLSGLTHLTAIGHRISGNDVRAAFERGCYFQALQRVLALYDRSALLVLQYERCCREPQRQLDRTFAHLGVDAHPVGPRLFGRAINVTEVPKPVIERSALNRLRDAYRPDVEALASAFSDIDISLWPNFARPGA